MAKLKFQICPRCELNFCEEGQEYCKICILEIERNNNPVPIEEKILCPICKSVYINIDEDMCENCQEEKGYDDFMSIDDERAESNWRSYIENSNSSDDDVNSDEIQELEDIEKSGLMQDVDVDDIDEDMENQFKEDYDDEFGKEDEEFEKESQEDDFDEFEDFYDEDFDDEDFDDEDFDESDDEDDF